ncbi:GmrSD restriction endonuclease domain-containing protein, partial [Romboutsia sp.]|uniref:GmrSD restriction endonuclease domain-containing protein n=1 Tax=Romboutsia sp. TaxID=1965302 RepID=UPI003F35C6F7
MSKGNIEADKEVLQKIFSQEFWFVVPEYQRPYIWQRENIEELLEDLYFAFENKVDSEYFLGSLVLK